MSDLSAGESTRMSDLSASESTRMSDLSASESTRMSDLSAGESTRMSDLSNTFSKITIEIGDNKTKKYILDSLQLDENIEEKNYYNYITDGINNILSLVDNNSDIFKLKCESEIGFIEYKLRLDTKTESGLYKTLYQIKRRLNTAKQLIGSEEAHYVFGIKDNGTPGELSREDVRDTSNIFEELIKSNNLNAYLYSKHIYIFDESCIYYVIIHKKNDIRFKEFKIAFVGSSKSGKTTTISHILHGTSKKTGLIFKHDHEKITGETTAIKKEIVGIKSNKLINYKSTSISSVIDIALESDFIINLFDYPGNIKKIKTIFRGLLSNLNDLIFVIIEACNLNNESDINMIHLYNKISKLLNIHMAIIVTKIDIYSYDNTVNQLFDIPVFYISNNNFEGIKILVNYLENVETTVALKLNRSNIINDVHKIISTEHKEDNNLLNNLFTISELINISDKGVVFSGIMHIGDYKIGDNILLTNGIECIETRIKSIHKKYIDSKILYQGESGSIQLENIYEIPDYYKRSVISRKPFVSYNNINFIIDKSTQFDRITDSAKWACQNIKKDDMFKLYVGNIRTTAIIQNITESNTTFILMLKLNPIIIPMLEIYGKTIGILRDNKKNTYCGIICILSTINE